jgi:RNA polymerase sigma-70 factor (ECF subfamily)
MTAAERDADKVSDAFFTREEWAFQEAYRSCSALLFSVAYNVLGNRSDAEECVRDTLVDVWQRANSYNSSRGTLRSFLVVRPKSRNLAQAKSRESV